MTKYKKEYKRKSGDRFLTYTLIGFAVLFFVIILSLAVFKNANKVLDYDDFDLLTSQSAAISQSEDKYLIYYYSDTCEYCKLIKTDVMEFADDNNADVKVYFWNRSVIGSMSLEAVTGTPAVMVVVNGQIVDVANGYIDIPLLFEDINAGTNTYIN